MIVHEEMIKIILDEAFYVHKIVGPGMLEMVYKACLAYRLRKTGFFVEIEKELALCLRGAQFYQVVIV